MYSNAKNIKPTTKDRRIVLRHLLKYAFINQIKRRLLFRKIIKTYRGKRSNKDKIPKKLVKAIVTQISIFSILLLLL